MRLIIITEEEPYLTHNLLNKIFQNKEFKIKLILLRPKVKLRRFFYFFFIFGFLNFSIFTIRYFYNKVFSKKIYSMAKKNDIEVYNIANINSEKFQKVMENHQTDLVFSINCSQIIQKKYLDLCKKKINLHLGKLYKYKGLFPVFYSILDKNEQHYSTIHEMTENIDSGKILREYVFDNASTDILKTYNKFYSKISETIISDIKNLYDNYNIIKYENNLNGDYYAYPSIKQLIKFQIIKFK